MAIRRLTWNLMVVLMLAPCAETTVAQTETVYMTVLSSRKHQWGREDNPVIGLFVSGDGGSTWVHQGWREYIRTFYAEAGPDGTLWLACGNGVLRSTDGGSTWRVTTGWEVTEVLKVKVDPQNASVVFAATAYGIIRTTDGGNTWEPKVGGLKRRFASDVCFDRGFPGRLLAATEVGVYVTTNSGEHWSLAGLARKGVRVILQDPHNRGTFWAGTEDDGVFVTVDGGRRWTERNRGLAHRTVYAIAFDPVHSLVRYIGTHGGGVYTSSDGGMSWRRTGQGLGNPDVHSLMVLPSHPEVVLAGTLNGGLYRSSNAGVSWELNSQDEGQVWGLSVSTVGVKRHE